MAHVFSQTASKSVKRITVLAETANNSPINGCDIFFYVDEILAGGVVGCHGQAIIECPKDSSVTARVDVMGESFLSSISEQFDSRTDFEVRLQLEPQVMPSSWTTPEARCADGTTGQPCVNCRVGSTTVRICG